MAFSFDCADVYGSIESLSLELDHPLQEKLKIGSAQDRPFSSPMTVHFGVYPEIVSGSVNLQGFICGSSQVLSPWQIFDGNERTVPPSFLGYSTNL